jgi:hypothetical protein
MKTNCVTVVRSCGMDGRNKCMENFCKKTSWGKREMEIDLNLKDCRNTA